MPEINLLQGNVHTASNSSALRILLNVLGVLIFLGVAGAGAYFYTQVKSVQAQDATTVATEATTQRSLVGDKNYQDFITSQKELSLLTKVFAAHLGWTTLIPKFSDATLKTATFTSFQATAQGGVDVSGSVPSFADLDKMMQGFQLQDFSTFVSSVSLVNVGLSRSSTGNSVSFTVHVQFNPATVKYENQ